MLPALLREASFTSRKRQPKSTGAHARVSLHSDKPVFYVHVMDDPGGDSSVPNWAIVRATVKNDRRILAQVAFTQLTGNAKRNDSLVDATVERLDNGWLKIISKEPLAPGEYALQPVLKAANTFSAVVFDFTVDPKGPNAPDAISAPTKLTTSPQSPPAPVASPPAASKPQIPHL